MDTAATVENLLESVNDIAHIMRKHAPEAEWNRSLSPEVVQAMVGAGLFRMWVPKVFGGLELDPMTAFRVIEEVARIDGAAAWNLQISISAGSVCALFTNDTPREIFGTTPDVLFAAAFSPPAQVVPVDGGYRLNARWSFGSGCQFAAWFAGPAVVMENGEPRISEAGSPTMIAILFPADDVEILDTWHTLGMRGTGSQDFIAKDVFIPEHRATSLALPDKPTAAYSGPLYRFGIWHTIAALVPPALGIARAAIDELITVAKGKTPRFTSTTLRERQVVQAQVAQAEALLGAGRAYLHEALRDGWETVTQGRIITFDQKVKLQLASTYAVQAAVQAVDLAHSAAGATAIREESPLARCFRDIHTMSGHAFVSASRYESVGQVLLGLNSEWEGWFAL